MCVSEDGDFLLSPIDHSLRKKSTAFYFLDSIYIHPELRSFGQAKPSMQLLVTARAPPVDLNRNGCGRCHCYCYCVTWYHLGYSQYGVVCVLVLCWSSRVLLLLFFLSSLLFRRVSRRSGQKTGSHQNGKNTAKYVRTRTYEKYQDFCGNVSTVMISI